MAKNKMYKMQPVHSSQIFDYEGFMAGAQQIEQQPDPATATEPSRSLLRTAGDYGLTAIKTAIAVPELAVGLADIPTGGHAGRSLEQLGFRPKEAKAMLDENYSQQQKDAFAKVQQADGFMGKMGAALENPSTIAHAVVESAGPMLAGGVVGKGIMAVAPRLGAVGAAAAGEGIIGAGSAAKQIRQETPDGLLTAKQAGLALATGAGTSAFGLMGGKLAQRLGIGDVDTMLVQGAGKLTAASNKGLVKRVVGGGLAEGVFEELPQSVQEQVLQNQALGKDPMEGVDYAAAMGLLSGATMGAGANVYSAPATAEQRQAQEQAKAQAQVDKKFQTQAQIERLRDAGDASAAELLQKRLNFETSALAADTEIASMLAADPSQALPRFARI